MSGDSKAPADFELRLQALLQEGVQRVSGRARSRLNRARHAALTEAARRRHWTLPLRAAAGMRARLLWMPAAGAVAAAVLVAFVLWPHGPQAYPAVDANHTTAEDLDLLADREGMDLMQGGDGQFYEWAVAQAGEGGEAAPAGTGHVKGHGRSGAGADQNSG